jgi:cyclophilin family peptidyl-prolyl cis-trans isomerase
MRALAFVFALAFSLTAFAAGPELSQERVIFHTNAGDMVVALFPKVAPKTTAKILEMVRAGLYDGIPIGRIEKGFVAQVYNFDSRLVPLTPEQTAHLSKLPAEFSPVLHQRGILSMAREDGDINSGEFSFSFLLGDAPHLDQQYTVFGQVVSGTDVLAAIEDVPTENQSAPIVPVTVERAEVIASAADLERVQLQPAHAVPLPYEKGKVLFEILAGLMFFFTVTAPIYKSVTAKRSA